MDYLCIILLIIVVFISIRELINSKKVSNDNIYGIYQNSRFYRLLFVVIACVFSIVMFVVRKIFY
ncbi:hypothetical protein HNP37_000015 [Flavobacterium nitrogenifigens]|uniref:Uncharacterized protein n=2 Tax=Flavobacterium TaxID=237 RepID=A0A7W7ISZ4_9FLAO|nr:hypothetical protein [Flavobacterium nitrogenifigens]MBB6386274.1 hypothetical protein [Flavobacterium notoginsengisoli]